MEGGRLLLNLHVGFFLERMEHFQKPQFVKMLYSDQSSSEGPNATPTYKTLKTSDRPTESLKTITDMMS